MKPDWRKLWKDNKHLVFFIVMLVAFKSSLADWNSVPTGSMKPTIVEGDRILVNKLAYDLKVPLTHIRLMSWGQPVRGDIVVFDSEAEKTRLVKRVVGLPGDTLAMQNNQLVINGALLHYSGLGTDGAYLQATEHLGETPHAMQVGPTGFWCWAITATTARTAAISALFRAAKSSAARDMWFYRSITTIITCRDLDGSFSLSMPLTAH